jgi:hypothetical protein
MANPGVMTRRKIRFCLLVLFQLQISIIAGRGILGVPAGPNEMLLSLTLAVVITLACITDSRIIAKPGPARTLGRMGNWLARMRA